MGWEKKGSQFDRFHVLKFFTILKMYFINFIFVNGFIIKQKLNNFPSIFVLGNLLFIQIFKILLISFLRRETQQFLCFSCSSQFS